MARTINEDIGDLKQALKEMENRIVIVFGIMHVTSIAIIVALLKLIY